MEDLEKMQWAQTGFDRKKDNTFFWILPRKMTGS